MKKYFLLFLFLTPAYAQQSSIDSTLTAIESLYNSGQYFSAELEARRLSEEKNLSDSVTIRIQKWIAFSLVAQGKNSLALERFASILTLSPTFDLDPVLTSPKILTVFNEAKTKFLSQQKQFSRDSAGETSSDLVKNNSVTFRTIVFPGLEQLHRRQSARGIFFFSLGAASLGSGITFEVLRSNARNEYLKSTVPSDISSKYNTYNTYRKAEIYSFITFGVVYVLSEIDVFRSLKDQRFEIVPVQSERMGSGMSFAYHF
jgi:hypothetical protein